jgi:thiamine biosynthesis lipoprotein ApbE
MTKILAALLLLILTGCNNGEKEKVESKDEYFISTIKKESIQDKKTKDREKYLEEKKKNVREFQKRIKDLEDKSMKDLLIPKQ